MSKESMVGVAKGAGLLLVAAALGLTAGCGGSKKLESSKDFHYLPSNCVAIGSVRMDEVLKSQAYKDVLAEVEKMTKDQGGAQKGMVEQFGLADQDVARITFGAAANGKDVVVVVATHKPVTASELTAKMKRTSYIATVDGVTPKQEPRQFKEVKVGSYTMHEEEGRGAEMALCVADEKTVLFSQAAALKAVLERDKAPELSPGMKAALDLANQSQPVFVAIDFKGAMAGEAKKAVGDLPEQASAHKDKVEAMAIDLAIAADVQAKLTVLCQDKEAASAIQKDAEKGVNDAKNILALLKDAPQMAKLVSEGQQVLDSVKVSAEGNQATASVAIKPLALVLAVQQLAVQSTQTFEKVGGTIEVPPSKEVEPKKD